MTRVSPQVKKKHFDHPTFRWRKGEEEEERKDKGKGVGEKEE